MGKERRQKWAEGAEWLRYCTRFDLSSLLHLPREYPWRYVTSRSITVSSSSDADKLFSQYSVQVGWDTRPLISCSTWGFGKKLKDICLVNKPILTTEFHTDSAREWRRS